MRLRPERSDDAEFGRALYQSVRMPELLFTGWPAAAKQAFLDDQYRLQSAHYRLHERHADRLIVARNGTAVGRLYIARAATAWRLIDIALLPQVRGSGLGTALIGWLIDGARDAGAAAVELQVARDNPRAAALYRRIGFVDAEPTAVTHNRLVLPIARTK